MNFSTDEPVKDDKLDNVMFRSLRSGETERIELTGTKIPPMTTASFEAVVVVGQSFMVEAYEVQQRGVEIVVAGFVDGRFDTELVAFTIAEPLLHTGSGKEARERVWVAIAIGSIGLQKRLAETACSRTRYTKLPMCPSMPLCLRAAIRAAVS